MKKLENGALLLKPEDFIPADLTDKDSSLLVERQLECISMKIQNPVPDQVLLKHPFALLSRGKMKNGLYFESLFDFCRQGIENKFESRFYMPFAVFDTFNKIVYRAYFSQGLDEEDCQLVKKIIDGDFTILLLPRK